MTKTKNYAKLCDKFRSQQKDSSQNISLYRSRDSM